MNKEELFNRTVLLFQSVERSKEESVAFFEKLEAIPGLFEEYLYYFEKGDFLGKYRVDEYTIPDILIWQMDHFRSHMDRADADNRYNTCKLIINTFETMIELTENPQKIKDQFQSETGTDLPSGWTTY